MPSIGTQTSGPAVMPVECVSCFEQTADPIKLAENEHLCLECFNEGIRPQFEAALRNETQYPVKWGGTTLKLEEYSHLFPDDLLAKWQAKEIEYKTPLKKRLYCRQKIDVTDEQDAGSMLVQQQCGAFLGSKHAAGKSGVDVVGCPKCFAAICSKCSDPVGGSRERHVCQVEEEDAFKGLERGNDWQQCPNKSCATKATLRDGCNEVHCGMCDTQFCFVCGEKPAPDHWTVGKPCPRFGKRGDPRAIHDGEDEEEDDDDEDEDEDDDAFDPMEAQILESELRALVDLGNLNMAAAVNVRREARARAREEERRIAETPQGILQNMHRRALIRMHGRLLNSPASTARENMHDLLHLLEDGLWVYTFELRAANEGGDVRPDSFHHDRALRIGSLVNTVDDDVVAWGRFGGLVDIALIWLDVWYEAYDWTEQ